MELRRYLGVLRRRLWLIVILLVIGGILGDLSTPQKATYAAAATIYVGSSSFNTGSSNIQQAGLNQQYVAATLIPTYKTMLGSEPIAEDAARRTGFNLSPAYVLSHTVVSTDLNTTLLTVTASDANPSTAQALANSVANAFTTKLQTLQPQQGQGAVPTIPAYVFQNAKLPTAPLPSKAKSNILKGGLVGLVLGIGLAGLLEYLDVTIKGPAEAEQRLELAVLGVIPMRRPDA